MVPPDRRVNSILLTIFNRIKSLVYAHLQNVIRATSLYITSSHPRGHSQRPRRQPTQWEPAARVDARRPAAARQVRGSQLHAREDADDPDEHAPENYAADN